ncbi:MAG TPA: flagellar export chaperone FliS [Chromatiales bacterium]|nr:flagellar export chaperone FliS [Chromatiales bacterium]
MADADVYKALRQYGEVRLRSEVERASPHRLIQMLMEGALDKIRTARLHMQRGNRAEKARHVSWAIAIVEGLQQALDMERGGEIAANLDQLYDYMQRRLVLANMENDPALLDEVEGLLREIKEAWDAVPALLEREAGAAAAAQAGGR